MKTQLLVSACALTAIAGSASAVTIDGVFTDFDTAPVQVAGGGNITSLRLDSDNSFVYVNYMFAAPTTPSAGGGTYLAIDIDNNFATGFDIFSANLIGAEAAYQNDFPFTMSAGVFNDGVGLVGAAVTNSDLFSAVDGVEIAIPIGAAINDVSNTPLFTPGQDVTIGVWNNAGELVVGTLTVVPEPTSLGMLATAGCLMLRRRRSTGS